MYLSSGILVPDEDYRLFEQEQNKKYQHKSQQQKSTIKLKNKNSSKQFSTNFVCILPVFS